MAAVAAIPAADQTADLMKNMALDSQTKVHDTVEVTKKPSSDQYGSINGEAPSASVPSREPSLTPLLQEVNQITDLSMCYLPSGYPSTTYVYGGYDSTTDWENYSRYMNQEGVDIAPGVYRDMYQHGYGYAPYGSYSTSPFPTMGNDGQHYGTQHYQYPTSYYQTSAPSCASYAPNQAPNCQADLPHVSVDSAKTVQNGTAKGNAKGSNVSVLSRASHQSASVATNGTFGRFDMPDGYATYGYQDPIYAIDGMQSPVQLFDSTLSSAWQYKPSTARTVSSTASRSVSTTSARTQSQCLPPHLMSSHATRPTLWSGSANTDLLHKTYPNTQLYGQFGNDFRVGYGCVPNGYDSRISGCWSVVTDTKYKPRRRDNNLYGYGNEDLDGFSELNRGPRAGPLKSTKTFGANVTIAAKGENFSTTVKEDSNGIIGANVTIAAKGDDFLTTVKEDSNGIIADMEQYNREDFPDTYSNAKFFIIKSYSEDDVHRSIKYNVWSSTPSGNRKLDTAYLEAQEKAGGCPTFLFFSVNTSGHFVGVAEMIGSVDFQKTLECWQQDKWFGCFPVKWHIVKDVPNSILKHITLENNDNKSVTNSRDTQEVKLEQGLQLLKLFKEYVNKISIFDDFEFYERREKLMQERKFKQKQFLKQGFDGKPNGALINEKAKDGAYAKTIPDIPLESISVLNMESAFENREEMLEKTGEVGS